MIGNYPTTSLLSQVLRLCFIYCVSWSSSSGELVVLCVAVCTIKECGRTECSHQPNSRTMSVFGITERCKFSLIPPYSHAGCFLSPIWLHPMSECFLYGHASTMRHPWILAWVIFAMCHVIPPYSFGSSKVAWVFHQATR